MPNYSINENLFNIFFSDNIESFHGNLAFWLISSDIYVFTLWTIKGNMCEPLSLSTSSIKSSFDIYELGYPAGLIPVNKKISFFDEEYFISKAFFLEQNNSPIFAITFHNDENNQVIDDLFTYLPYLSKRYSELTSLDKSMDLYVDYQRKIDFVTKAGRIFKALEVNQVVSVSLSFFTDIFSADVVCAFFNDEFYGIGIEKDDLLYNISIGNTSIYDYMQKNKKTEFLENNLISLKYNVKNVFFIYEETSKLHFALFNIISDIVPDKEFSSIVSSIISVAVENAINHELHTQYKIEETEINRTIEILNKFVPSEVSLDNYGCQMYALNIPAKQTGGDFADMKDDGNGNIKFCVADVCGKGYTAAILTVVLSVLFSTRTKFDLSTFIHHINTFLLRKKFDDKFVTGFFGEYDANTRKLKYIYCGHEPAYLITDDKIQHLFSKNLPLGIVDENYETKEISIPKGASLFLYTDGILEYTKDNEIKSYLKENISLSPKDNALNLYKKLVTDKDNQKDDFTCIIMKF